MQGVLWKLNGFDKLKDIKQLEDYEPRHDPTVAPGRNPPFTEKSSLLDLPRPRLRQNASSYYTCADYHELFKSGRLTPLDVVEHIIPLVSCENISPSKYSVAFLQVRADLVRAAAKASTERYKKGQPLSVLDGVPVAVKDEVDLAGHRRTLGSKLDFTNPNDETAWCVEKWQQAGAIILGKTNMHELGLDTTNNNPHTGTPLNPHNSGYYTGGSSGGSACVTAQGLCPLTLGADGGGSIRLPSSFCGIYGLKPTHSQVSGRPTRDLGVSVGVYGPMASSIDDLATGYRIMAQPDPGHRGSALFPESLVSSTPSIHPPGSTRYLGICRDWVDRADKPVLDMFEAAVTHYAKAYGYEVVEIQIPFLPQGQKAHAMTILSEIRSGVTTEQISQLTYANQLLLNVAGSHATAQDFLFAQRLRDLLMSHLAWLWEEYPGMLILTPTTPCAGWKIGKATDITSGYGVSDGDMSLRSMEYVYLANFTGCPALSCPLGYAETIPVGIMVCSLFFPFISHHV